MSSSSKDKDSEKKATLHKDKEKDSSHSLLQEDKSKHQKKPSEVPSNDKLKTIASSNSLEKQSPEVRHRGASGSNTNTLTSSSNSTPVGEKESSNDLVDQVFFF